MTVTRCSPSPTFSYSRQAARVHVFWRSCFGVRTEGRGWDFLVAYFQMTYPSFKCTPHAPSQFKDPVKVPVLNELFQRLFEHNWTERLISTL